MDKKRSDLRIKAFKYFLKFLAAMIVLTFVSRGVYAHQMPRVKIDYIRNAPLSYQFEAFGIIDTSRELPIYAMPDLLIEEVFVKSGDTVSVKDPILKYDENYLEKYIAEISRQIETDMLTRSDYYSAQAWNSAKILTMQIEDNQKKLENYQNILDGDAVMLSQTSGMITDIKVNAGEFTSETASFMIADTSENLYFSGQVTEEQSKLIFTGDVADIEFRNGRIRLEDCKIKSISSSESDDMYKVEIPIENSDLKIGEIGEMSIKVMSEERYNCIPLEAIHKNGGQSFIYIVEESEGFLGKEYHISVHNVVVSEQNETYVAIADSGLTSEDMIVTYASKDLHDGQTVRM